MALILEFGVNIISFLLGAKNIVGFQSVDIDCPGSFEAPKGDNARFAQDVIFRPGPTTLAYSLNKVASDATGELGALEFTDISDPAQFILKLALRGGTNKVETITLTSDSVAHIGPVNESGGHKKLSGSNGIIHFSNPDGDSPLTSSFGAT